MAAPNSKTLLAWFASLKFGVLWSMADMVSGIPHAAGQI
jgi:hypothetical protein